VAPDRQEVRWYYTIVLTETAGKTIQFEREQFRGSGGPESVPGDRVFRAQLKANSELRINHTYRMYDIRRWPPPSATVFYRYLGTDETGTAVTVDAFVTISTSVGRVIPQPMPTSQLPPPKLVQPEDLKTLAGIWQGFYRDDKGFEVPLRLNVKPDGSFEATEDDPVTGRFRGTVRIEDGRVRYSRGNDTGILTLHEGGGNRVIEGHVAGKREGLPDRPGAAPYTVNYLVRLEPASVKTSSSPTPIAPKPQPQAETGPPPAPPAPALARPPAPPVQQAARGEYEAARFRHWNPNYSFAIPLGWRPATAADAEAFNINRVAFSRVPPDLRARLVKLQVDAMSRSHVVLISSRGAWMNASSGPPPEVRLPPGYRLSEQEKQEIWQRFSEAFVKGSLSMLGAVSGAPGLKKPQLTLDAMELVDHGSDTALRIRFRAFDPIAGTSLMTRVAFFGPTHTVGLHYETTADDADEGRAGYEEAVRSFRFE
jgi:hypothetical protein